MKVQWTASLVALSLLGVAPLSQVLADPNPYEEGVIRVELTPAERESLMLYANNSKALLDKAMKEAKGKPLSEANDIYVTAIKRVVAESFKERRRSELLMRMALNQGLELTVGVPTADGTGVQKEGILKGAQNLDLITTILEDSIRLALSYYQDDRTAIETGNLIHLPYSGLAQEHLILGKEWLSGVNEWAMQLALSQAILEQWQRTVLQEDHLARARYAEVILDVEDSLKKIESNVYTTSQKVRFLRGVLERVQLTGGGSAASKSVSSHPVFGAFVRIPRGSFIMGSPEAGNQHQVTLTRDFEMATTTVTQKQWVSVMGKNPSNFQSKKFCPEEFQEKPVAMCPRHPVEQVSWNDVQLFISKLNDKKDGYTYRLPTEAEWEYAARAGTTTAYWFGDSETDLDDSAWHIGNSGGNVHAVATKKPNPWGLYDIYGNVWQWVMDYYGEYPSGPVTDPLIVSGTDRVMRGGAGNTQSPRSAMRAADLASTSGNGLGFRLVRTKAP